MTGGVKYAAMARADEVLLLHVPVDGTAEMRAQGRQHGDRLVSFARAANPERVPDIALFPAIHPHEVQAHQAPLAYREVFHGTSVYEGVRGFSVVPPLSQRRGQIGEGRYGHATPISAMSALVRKLRNPRRLCCVADMSANPT